MQLPLFGDLPDPHHLARHGDPETSHQAARNLKTVTITVTRQVILTLLAVHGPLTDEQIADRYNGHSSPSGLRTRRAELVDAGYVIDSGRRTTTRSGRATIIWQINNER